MGTSAGKRRREQQKLEKVQAKAERRASRQQAEADDEAPAARSESELIEDLRALQQAFEAGEISPERFEERREQLQAQFGRLS